MSETINWGIIGPGNIAKKFATGLQVLPEARLLAVGSRSQATADAFGDQFDVPRRYDSYEALVNDADVQAVYVATPHHLHMDNTLLALEAGKAVICEKPFAINAAQAQKMVDKAREKGLFLMEAMWTRYLPIMVKLRELLAAKVIGEMRMITADFGYRASFNPQSRAFDPHLGGGGLLDVGIYPLSLAYMVLGQPSRISSMAELGETGVDEQAAFVLGYEGGAMAVCTTAVRTNTPHEAFILGTNGRIKIPSPWWVGKSLTVSVNGQPDEEIQPAFVGNGWNYEAEELMACLRAGKLESEIMPLDESLQIMGTMDAIRAQWGMKYPME
ncbi:MAG: Gfo/Idh/MocA family oxidoreductase [Ardenticatenaceae bacterium]|nr:Gfo/Idh/MocA family oxidoreductase [Ardenticatenaceae bacterium]